MNKKIKKQPKTPAEKLQDRARRKFLTNSLAAELVKLDSPLNKSYAITFGCCRQLLVNRDHKLSSPFYCKKRWCMTCASIQMGTQINNYRQPLSKLNDLHLVTLTFRNVPAESLPSSLDGMTKTFRRITDGARKQGRKLTGLRKLELKVDSKGFYHPHYHLIVESAESSQYIVDQWLKRYGKSADPRAQDISKINNLDTALTEVMKYATKLTCAEDTTNEILCTAKQMDVIFCALHRRRLYQPFGNLSLKSEDDFQPDNPEVIKRAIGLYEWIGFDWYHIEYAQALTNYHPEALEIYNYRS